eukprot:GFYU01003381.1.p1 GENE.GFYU01003381.1~~GFYU01003381.1.p1  ORF type:complete len:459 (-),score=169.37 GFYU01003381.1:184-1560(-)
MSRTITAACAVLAVVVLAACMPAAKANTNIFGVDPFQHSHITFRDFPEPTNSCSEGHGMHEIDMADDDCECFQCYTGPTCDVLISDCTISMAGGQPMLAAQFWEQEVEKNKGVDVVPARFRAAYQYTDMLPSLQAVVTKLHAVVGNAETEGRHFIAGAGATQLLGAAMYASVQKLMREGKTENIKVFAKPPFYFGYPQYANTLVKNTNFNSSFDLDGSRTVEMMTVVNNPTFEVNRAAYYKDSLKIYDFAYYWPSYVKIDKKFDEDVMIFTLSKLTGHAGTRLGWALIKDKQFATDMKTFIAAETLTVQSVDAQMRGETILKALLAELTSSPADSPVTANLSTDEAAFPVVEASEQPQTKLFEYIHTTLMSRWNDIHELFETGPAASKFKVHSPPGAYYLWLQCLDATGSCEATMGKYGITGVPGDSFAGTPDYMRINVMVYDSTWKLFVERMKKDIQ